MSRKIIGGIAVAVASAAIGWFAHVPQQPDCPTEDSCSIDYRNGAWHIEPDIP